MKRAATQLRFDMKRTWDAGSMRTVSATIENSTGWLDRDLAKIVRRVLAIEEVPPGHLTVRVVYGRGNPKWCSGYATYRRWWMVVRVPSPERVAKAKLSFPCVDFAHVVAHEIGHAVFGKRHREMGFHYRRGAYSDKVFAWAQAVMVRPKAEPKRPTLDVKRKGELKRALANVTKYTRRVKLGQTLLKKWTRRVAVLEKRLAAEFEESVAAQTPGGETCPEQSDPQTLAFETKAASSC